ncbi:hypothetical protein HZB02_01065 [Candidatus Woesearchaeota archaeon]|nr:hypothetical protein [Candidatus Woesearchaeota archaeon]
MRGVQSSILTISILGFLIILSAAAMAEGQQTFDVNVKVMEDQITSNGTATAEVTITNYQDKADRFVLGSPNRDIREWFFMTDPTGDITFMDVPANSSYTTKLYLSPMGKRAPIEFVTLTIFSQNTGEVRGDVLQITITDLRKTRTYAPNVKEEVTLSSVKTNPKLPLVVRVALENENKLELTNVTINVVSPYFSGTRTVYLAPGPGTKKTEELSFDLDPLLEPAKDTVLVTLWYEGKVINQVRTPIEIIPYSEITQQYHESKRFLQQERIVTYFNDGNVEKQVTLKIPTTFLKSWVTTTVPRANAERGFENSDFSLDYRFKPNEYLTVKATTSYRGLFTTILIVIVLIVLYYTFRSPLVVKKTTTRKGDAAISDVKVMVHLRNRSKQKLDNLQVIEKLPNLVHVIPYNDVGTLKPSRILAHDKKGALIKWELPVLESFEERIITYQIKAKLEILGGLTIHPTNVRFEDAKGNKASAKSNTLAIKE